MKITEFKLLKTRGTTLATIVYFAEVTVTTRHWWWKKTERKKVFRNFGHSWRWMGTGTPVGGNDIDNYAVAWRAQTGENC